MFLKPEHADPEPNTDSLNEIFNVSMDSNRVIDTSSGEAVDVSTGEILGNVSSMRKELQALKENLPDADKIITDNIARANRILDRVEDTVGSGAFTAAMIEAAAKLIDSVTSAANSITGISFNAEVIRQKDRDLDRKEKELLVKSVVKGADNVTVNNNTLVLNREELLKIISEQQEDDDN